MSAGRRSRGVPAGLSGVVRGASREPGVSADRAMGAGRPGPAGVEIDLCQPRRGLWPAAAFAAEYRRYLIMAIGSVATKCRYGCAIAVISATLRAKWRSDGAASTRRLPGCCPASLPAVRDNWFLIPVSEAVAERSVGRRRCIARCAGGIGSENADMSSVNEGEKPSRRKSKGSCARLFRAGLAGPLRRGREP